ncbi:MAG: hypothetical protein IKT79_04335, partial [Akkermansia sp.]|nr:hypothetical protein [Akkermansia sp.]
MIRHLLCAALAAMPIQLCQAEQATTPTLTQHTQTTMFNKERLEKCSNAAGVSGFEDDIRAVIEA